jgi:hypothetical protein
MKTIYTASKTEKVILKLSNNKITHSIVMVNDVVIDECDLADAIDNTRVLEIDLNEGDVIKVNENELIVAEVNGN